MLKFNDIIFCVIEPPYILDFDNSNLWIADTGLVDISNIYSSNAPEHFPKNAFIYYLFINNWNAFIYISALNVSFEWLCSESIIT